MAARASGSSLLISYIRYTLSHNLTIPTPPVVRPRDRDRSKLVIHPV